MAEMKNICGKIPVDLHEKVRREIEETQSSTQKFIQQVIEEHFSKGEMSMEKRTLAVQVSEELFGRLKAVIAKMGCKQKDFLIGIIEEAIAEEEKRLGLAGNQEGEPEETAEGEPENAEPEEEPETEEPETEEPETEEPETEETAEMETGMAEADEEGASEVPESLQGDETGDTGEQQTETAEEPEADTEDTERQEEAE